jgi:hypothetical protein
MDSGAFHHDVVNDSIENERLFVSAIPHFHRRTLVTRGAPVALRVIKPRSSATTVANKKFFRHERY